MHILNVQASENDERNIFFDRFVTGGLKTCQSIKNMQVELLPCFARDIKQKGIKILMSNLKAGLSSLRARPQHVIVHTRESATQQAVTAI